MCMQLHAFNRGACAFDKYRYSFKEILESFITLKLLDLQRIVHTDR